MLFSMGLTLSELLDEAAAAFVLFHVVIFPEVLYFLVVLELWGGLGVLHAVLNGREGDLV